MNRIKSFIYAFNGMKILLKEEPNSRIHLLATIIVICAGWYFNITISEWIYVTFAFGIVFAMETVNSAIENIADFIHPEKHESIKRIKDLAAGAVLFSAIASAIVGLLIFIPKIIKIW